MIMRALVLAARSLVGLLLLTGMAAAQDKVRIGLPVPKAAAYIGLHAAVDRGFFKEIRVEPEITVFRGGAASQEAMSAGVLDLHSYFPGAVGLVQTKGGQKEKCVAMIDDRPLGWL